MGLSCPLGISRVGLARKSSTFGHIIDPLLTELVPSRWLNYGLILDLMRGQQGIFTVPGNHISANQLWTQVQSYL